jgi:hypothetical protein
MSSMTKLNRYICGCNSAVLLRLCPAWLCSNPHVHLAVCGPVCGCLVPTCLLSGCGDSRCSSGPSLYIGCAIPAWSGRPAWPCFGSARGNQRQIREAALGPLPVQTHHLDQALEGGRFQFCPDRSCTVTRSLEKENPDSRYMNSRCSRGRRFVRRSGLRYQDGIDPR